MFCMECHLVVIGTWALIDPSDVNIFEATQRKYRQNSNARHPSIGNKIVDHSDVVEASHVGVSPTTSSFST